MKQLNLLDELAAGKNLSTPLFDYQPALFNKSESNYYLQHFINTIQWHQHSVIMYGKEIITPRLTAWFGNAVDGTDKQPRLAWTPALLQIKEKIEPLAGIAFNSVLLNYYRDGNDSVSWHSDNDGIPGKNRFVASVSFGQERMFDVRNTRDHSNKFSVLLEDGSYFLMKEDFQEQWQHRIAKSKMAMRPRINLTFRILE